eukprot:scaffold223975_cov15-Tisochrysis_lutea.AAC.1
MLCHMFHMAVASMELTALLLGLQEWECAHMWTAEEASSLCVCAQLHTVYMDGNISIQVLIRGKTPPAHINKHSPRPLPTDLKLMRFCFLPLPPIPCLPVSTFTAPPAAT